jgi:hypothetical protein
VKVMQANTVIREHIHTIIATIDRHDAGILDGTFVCPCGFKGAEGEWELHIADVLDHQLAEVVTLPNQVSRD